MKKVLEFTKLERVEGYKTDIWNVENVLDGSDLGQVRWFGRWRQYSFFPGFDLVFEKNCLRTIAQFCEDRTKEFYAEKKATK